MSEESCVKPWIRFSSATLIGLLLAAMLLVSLDWSWAIADTDPLLAAWEKTQLAGGYDFAVEMRHYAEGQTAQHVHATCKATAPLCNAAKRLVPS
jgi:hypothetical protein